MSDDSSVGYNDRPGTWRERLTEVREIPLDILLPVAPRYWCSAAHHLASGSPGWQPPMVLFAALGTIFLSHELLGRFAFLHVPHIVTGAIVSVVAMYLVARRAAVVFPRYGAWGFTRPRWWFELGRMLCIICMVSAAAAIGIGFAGLGNVGPIGDAIFRALMRVGAYAFVAFIAVATNAYLLSIVCRLPRRGRAFECVEFFYAIIVACLLVTPAVMLFRADRFALVALGIAAVAAVAAGVVALVARDKKPGARSRPPA